MPYSVIETYLHPGATHVAGSNTRIHTFLGSCVAIVAWHRPSQCGGMSHYLLPEHYASPRHELDGRYAGDALELLRKGLSRFDVKLRDCDIRLFGGSALLSPLSTKPHILNVGRQNIDAAKTLLRKHDLTAHAQHLGGTGHRKLIFDIANGDVGMWMWHKHIPEQSPTEALALAS